MADERAGLGPGDLRDAVFDAAPHGYLVLDPGLVIVDVNRHYLDLTRTRREDLVGVPLFEAFPDNPADATADGTRNLGRSLETVLATGRPHAMAVQKYDIPRREGPAGGFEERYWKPLNAPVLRDGRVVALIHHVVDVTEETLSRRDQAVRLRSAARLNDLAFWEYDPRTGTASVSRAFARMLGLDEEGTVDAETCFARVHRDDVAAVRAAFAAVMDAPEHTTVAFAHRVPLPDGAERWVSSHGEVVRDHRDAMPRFVGVSLDATEDRRREAALGAALAERDRLLAQKEALLGEVNHRIKNSLQLVASLIAMDARRAEGAEARARLDRAAARVQAVTSVHETLYRSNEVSTVAFGPYLRELCAALAEGDAGAAPVEIVCESAEVELPADEAIALALIVNELVANALGHAFAGRATGRVRVSTRPEAGALVLEVADDGAGRPPGARAGLGTRIVHGLAEQLGATVGTRDAAPGHAVVVRAPLARP